MLQSTHQCPQGDPLPHPPPTHTHTPFPLQSLQPPTPKILVTSLAASPPPPRHTRRIGVIAAHCTSPLSTYIERLPRSHEEREQICDACELIDAEKIPSCDKVNAFEWEGHYAAPAGSVVDILLLPEVSTSASRARKKKHVN